MLRHGLSMFDSILAATMIAGHPAKAAGVKTPTKSSKKTDPSKVISELFEIFRPPNSNVSSLAVSSKSANLVATSGILLLWSFFRSTEMGPIHWRTKASVLLRSGEPNERRKDL